MARLYPFRALRYNTERVRMEDVVTEPYDKISPAMQQRYYERSPVNLIRVILGKREPTDTDPQEFLPPGERAHNVYTRAATFLHDWRADGTLVEEAEPALYGYSQTYQVPNSTEIRERRGFIALGHLYDYADKVVYRHEQTFPKHKSDRLALFKATRTYCEQIYMLYSDPAFTAEKLIFGAGNDAAPPDQTIQDDFGVTHRLWRVTDPGLINLILTAMRDKKLIIADGHHRYETSVAYAKERSAQLNLPFNHRADENDESPSNLADESHSLLPRPPFPEAAMMMTFVNTAAPGITILPTHRVVTGIETFSSSDFLTRASQCFTVRELPSTNTGASSAPEATLEASAAQALLDTLNATPGTAFVAVTGSGNFLLTPIAEAVAPLLASLSPRQRALDVVQLHTVILHHLLGLTEDKVRATGSILYLREATDVLNRVETGEANIAFLTKPVTLEQMLEISLSGEVMPQKSTDFYPKLLSGLAMYALDPK